MKFCLASDTRLVEAISAMSLIASGTLAFVLGVDHHTPGPITSHEPSLYWSLLSIIFGGLHIRTIISRLDFTMLRGILSWFSGSFWTWMALEGMMQGDLPVHVITTLALGFACYYSFTVNTLVTLREELK